MASRNGLRFVDRWARRWFGARRPLRRRLGARLCLESLEDRLTPAAISWDGEAGNFDWNNALNWSSNTLPGAADDVTIDVPAAITVVHGSGSTTINSLVTAEALNLTGGSLTVVNGMTIRNTFSLAGGTLRDTTVSTDNAATMQVTSAGGTLDGVTLGINTTLVAGAQLRVNNSLTLANNVLLKLNQSFVSGALDVGLDFVGGAQSLRVQTPGDSAIVELHNAFAGNQGGPPLDSNARIRPTGTGSSLTIGAGITVRTTTNSQLTSLGNPGLPLIIEGTVLARSSGRTLRINGSTVTNTGTLAATAGELQVNNLTGNVNGTSISGSGDVDLSGNYVVNLPIDVPSGSLTLRGTWDNESSITTQSGGTINLSGTFQVDDLGTFTGTAGTVNVITGGTLNDPGATLNLDATRTWQLDGGTIRGVTIDDPVGLFVPFQATSNGGTLDGVTLSVNTTLLTGAQVSVTDDLTLTDGVLLKLNQTVSTTAFQVGLNFAGGAQSLRVQTPDDRATVELHNAFAGNQGGPPTDDNVRIQPTGVGSSLTIGSGITVRTTTNSQLASLGSPGLPLIIEGSLLARSNQTFRINGSTVTNTGTLGATAGTLEVNNLTGHVNGTSIAGGTVELRGNYVFNEPVTVPSGTLRLTGIWDNESSITQTGGTIDLSGTFQVDDLGTFTGTAGTVNVITGGTLNDPGATLNLDATRTWQLDGGTIRGVTIDDPVGLFVPFQATSNGGTLDGVTLSVNTTLLTGAQVSVTDDLTLTDGVLLKLNQTVSTTAFQVGLNFAGGAQSLRVQTPDDRATVELHNAFAGNQGGPPTDDNVRIRPTGAGSSLTIGSGVTVQTTTNSQLTSLGNPGLPLIIEGTVLARSSGRTLRINGSTATNAGTLHAANGALLDVTATPTNVSAGTLTGGTWQATNGGDIRLPAGTSVSTLATTVVVDGASSNFEAGTAGSNVLAALSAIAASGSLTIQNGRNFSTSGGLTTAGNLTIGAGSIFTVAGNSDFVSGATLGFGLNSPYTTAGTHYGQMIVNGTVNLGDATLNLFGGAVLPARRSVMTLISNDASDAVAGTFNNLADNEYFTLANLSLVGRYAGGSGNDFVLVTTGLTATENAGNLTIAEAYTTGEANQLTISRVGDNLQIRDAVEMFGAIPAGATVSADRQTLTIPLAGLSSLTINGGGGNDVLTVDLSTGNPIPAGGLVFNGGDPTSGVGDALVIVGGAQGTVTYNHTNASDGTVVMSNFGTITYTGLEPITNTGSATDIIFNLPAVANAATLGDDGISGNGLSRLSGATFETTDFTNPTNSLTINRGNAADTITVAALPDFNAALTLGSAAAPFATSSFTGAVSLAAGNDLSVVATAVNVTASGNVSLPGGDVAVVAADVSLAGPINAISVSIVPPTGGALDVGTNTAGQLCLTDAELDQITAAVVQLGDNTSGSITISAAISPANYQTLRLGNAANFAATGGFTADVASPTVYERMQVAGALTIHASAALTVTAVGGFVPSPTDRFTLIENTSAATTSGTFAGKPERAKLSLGGVTKVLSYIDGTGNDILLTTGTLSAVLDNGNLTIADVGVPGSDNRLTVSVNGDNLVFSDTVEQFVAAPSGSSLNGDLRMLTVPLSAVTGTLTINLVGGSDTLTVDLSGGNPLPASGLVYNGGIPTTSPDDSLVILGGAQGLVTYTYTNAHDGTVTMSNFGTITYTGLEPIVNTGTATDLVFNLPAGPNTATLGDDGTVGNGLSRLSGATFETTDFTNPTNSLTINRGNAADALTINALPDFSAGLTIGSVDSPVGSVNLTGAVTLAANRSLAVYSGSAAVLNGSTLTTSGTGGVSLVARSGVTVSGIVMTGSGGFTADADSDDDGTGVFTVSAATMATWSQQAQVFASDGAANDRFGFPVAIHGDTAVVGAHQDDTNRGAAYVFVRNGAAWTQQQKLVASDGLANDRFGYSVAISGGSIVVGARQDDGTATDQGSAYVFVRSGTTWTQQQKLLASVPGASDEFGSSVAISGNTVLVSSWLDNGTLTDQGSAYVFARSGTTWTFQQQLLAADPGTNDRFGYWVALDADTAVVGAYLDDVSFTDQGSAYVFTRSGTTWTQQQKLTAADGAASDSFGIAVSLSGDTIVVGAYLDDVSFTDQGSAYVFTRSGTTWTQQQKLTAADGAASDNFGGFAVSVSGDTAVIGAWLDDVSFTDQGSAYVFTRSGTTWTQQQKLTAGDGAASDDFGVSVALSGDTIIVGAYLDNVGANADQGSAYFFKLNPATSAGAIATAGGPVSLTAADVVAGGTLNAGSGTLALIPSAGQAINVGSNAAGQVGITDSELDMLTADVVQIGDASSGAIAVSAAISPANYQTLRLGNATTFSATGGFAADVSSASVYERLEVNGALTIDPSATLTATAVGGFVPDDVDAFTLVANLSEQPTTGAFAGLPQYATVTVGGVRKTLSYVAGTGNDVVLLPYGTLTATNVGGSLTIADVHPTGQNNQLTLRRVGNNLVLTDASEPFFGIAPGDPSLSDGRRTLTIPLSSISGSLTINLAGGNDTLTVDLSNGNPLPSGGLVFNGGDPTSGVGDALVIVGGAQGTVTYNHTNASDGTVVMSNFGTITYTGLEPITNSGSATDIIFNLPAVANAATLADDSIVGNGLSRLSGATFETTDFTNPSNSLTINRGHAADTITVAALPDFNATLTLGTAAAPFATSSFTGAVTLAAGNDLTVAATAVNVTASGNLALPGGDVAVIAADVSLAGPINADSVNIVPPTGRAIDVGTNTAGQLSLTDAELDQLTAAVVQLGDSSSGAIAITAAISPANYQILRLQRSASFTATGGFASDIASTTVYERLQVAGAVSVSATATLNVTAVGGFVPAASDAFTIIENTSAGATAGMFAGKPEFANLSVGGVNKTITYVGGTGNDVVLFTAPPAVVTGVTLTDGTPVNENTVFSGIDFFRQVRFTFDRPLNASDVTNLAHWSLSSNGVDHGSGLIQGIGYANIGGVWTATVQVVGFFQASEYALTLKGTLPEFDGDADGTAGGDFTRTFRVATTTATLSDGNLVIEDIGPERASNQLTVGRSGDNLVFSTGDPFVAAPAGGTLSNYYRTLTIPLAAVTGTLTINLNEGNDTLIVDLSGGAIFPPQGIVYNGGSAILGSSGLGDSLVIAGGDQGTVTYNYTNATDGSVVMSNFGTITYTSLEPITNTGSATDIIFNLPVGPNVAVLEDDAVVGNGLSRLRGGTFELTDFANPTGTLTINRGSAADTLTLNNLPDLDAQLNLGAPASPFQQIGFAGSVTLAANRSLSATATTITVLDPSVVTVSGAGGIRLLAEDGITIDGDLNTGSAGLVVDADSDADGVGTFAVSGPVLANWTEQTKLTTPGGPGFNTFGFAVAISGDTAVVGAPSHDLGLQRDRGAVYVYVRSGGVWTEQAQLLASDGAADDEFGWSVGISGDTIVVGARDADIGANADAGSAYVFVRSGSVWTEQAKLTAGDGAANDAFGDAVAISGNTIVVGANEDDIGTASNRGSAYVFMRSGSSWSQQAKLSASDGLADDNFGGAVAIDVDTVVVGAEFDDIGTASNRGSAYVFTRSGTAWSQQTKLTASDGLAQDRYGAAVAISGNTVVIGAPRDDTSPATDRGSAYVHVRSGTVWSQQAKLLASDGATSDVMGDTVSIDGNTIVVGAGNDDVGSNANQGSAYVFTRSGTTWTEQARLTGSGGAALDNFGAAVAISGDTVLAGVEFDDVGTVGNQGSAYVLTRSGTIWTEQAHLTASDGGAEQIGQGAGDGAGHAVAIDGDTLVLHAYLDDVFDGSEGSLHVFRRSGAVWMHEAKLVASTGFETDFFANKAVALSGDTIVVGQDNSALVFHRTGTTWAQQATLVGSDTVNGDDFGHAVAISGDTIVVGAIDHNPGTPNDGGSAYVFVRSGTTWTQQAKLIANLSGDNFGNLFGSAVDIDGDTIIVGDYDQYVGSTEKYGAAHVFHRTGTTWTHQAQLIGQGQDNQGAFGFSVAVSGDSVLVGAYLDIFGNTQGAAYVFTRTGSNWSQQALFLGTNDDTSFETFGYSVDLEGDTAVVGAYNDEIDVVGHTGAAYVYTRSGSVWALQNVLSASDPANTDKFGWAVAISGDLILVGDNGNFVAPNGNQGAGYLFKGFPTSGARVSTNGGPVTVSAAAVRVGGLIDAASGTVILVPSAPGQAINLGSNVPGQFSLLDADVDRIDAARIQIGNAASGPLTIAQDISRPVATEVSLVSGAAIEFTTGSLDTAGGNLTLVPGAAAAVTVAQTGVDVNLGTTGILSFADGADLNLSIDGPTPDTEHHQLSVVGQLDLTGVDLVLTGSYFPTLTDRLLLIANDGSDEIVGTFNGLAEGEFFYFNGVERKITYVGGDGNDVEILPTGTLQAALSGGDLTIEDAFPGGRDNQLLVYRNGDNLVIADTSEAFFGPIPDGSARSEANRVLTIPISAITGSLTINLRGGGDTLTLALTNGNPIPAGGLRFNGGEGAPDTLAILGGDQGTVTYDYTNASDGAIAMSNFGTVFYEGLEPIVNTGTATDVVFNLPAGANNVTLGDDGTTGNGLSRLSGATLATTDFTNPTNSLTVNSGSATDSLTINTLADFDASLTVGALASPFGAVDIVGTIALAADNDLEVFSRDIEILTTGILAVSGSGSVRLTALEAVIVDGTVTADLGPIVVSADSDQDGDGTFSHFDKASTIRTNGGNVSLTGADHALGGIIDSAGGDVAFLPSRAGAQITLGGGTSTRLNNTLVANGDVTSFRVSPDGTRVVFLADQDANDRFELYSVPVGGGTVTRLNDSLGSGRDVGSNVTGTDHPIFLISPDSSRVVYLADRDVDNRIELFSVPIAGGAVTKLNEPLFSGFNVQYVQISPDSSRVVFRARLAADSFAALYSVPIAGGMSAKLSTGSVSGSDIVISPDSARVVYTSDQDTVGMMEVFSVPLAGGTSTQLNPAFASSRDVRTGSVQISPDSTRVLYVADQISDEVLELFSVPITGGSATRLNGTLVPGGEVVYFSPRISPDSSRVVYVADQTTNNVHELFSVPITGGTATKLNGPIVTSDVSFYSMKISQDNSRVIFLANQQLYSAPLIGGAAISLTLGIPSPSGTDTQISPDGSRVVFSSGNGLYSVPLTGGSASLLTRQRVDFNEFRISSDGQTVVFAADGGVHSVPIEGGSVTRLVSLTSVGGVSNGNTAEPGVPRGWTISPDSTRVVYIADQDARGRQEIYSALLPTGILTLREDELDRITTGVGTLIIGNDTAGDIRVEGSVTPAGTSVLQLVSGNSILTTDPGNTIAASSLALDVAGNIGSGNALRIDADLLAARSRGAGTIRLADSDGLTLAAAGVLGLVGVATTQGDIDLSTAGTLVVEAEINARGDGNVNVTAGGDLLLRAPILSTAATTGNAGDGAGSVRLAAPNGAIFTQAGVAATAHVRAAQVTLLGTVAPGASPGQLVIDGNVTLDPSVTFLVELDGLTPGTEYDQIVVLGANRVVELSGSTLATAVGAGLPAGALTLVLIDNVDPTSSISGTFAGLLEGQTLILSDGTPATITYRGGVDNNDVVLMVGNQPPTVSANLATVAANEGGMATNTGTFDDPQGRATVTLAANVGSVTQDNATGLWTWTLPATEGPAGPISVTITATDVQGATATATFTYSVTNVAPSFDAGADEALLSAGVFGRNAIAFTDPGTLDVHTVRVDYDGNGTIDDTINVPLGARTFDLSHTYAAPGTYTVSVTLSDDDGGTLTDTFTVTVNAVPVSEAGGPYTVGEGSSVVLDGSGSSDANQAAATLTYVWDLDGDGVFGETGAVAARGDETGVTPTFSAVGLDGPSQVTVSLRVTDAAGESSLDTATVNINNVAPSVGVTNPSVTVAEATTATNSGTFSDPGIDVVTLSASVGSIVDNGDGTWSWSFATNDGPDESQTVTITATDSDGAVSTVTFNLVVTNAAPTVAANDATVTVNEGASVNTSGTFGDVGLDTVLLDASLGTIADNGDGTWSWTFAASDGPDESQTVTITATDSDGAVSTATFALVVNNLAPSVTVLLPAVTVEEGATATNSGTFSDPGLDVVQLSASFGTVVDNGDGTWSWSKPRADGPDDTLLVVITASDGLAQTQTSFQLTVNDIVPVIDPNGSNRVVLGGTFRLSLSDVIDPGTDTVTEYWIHWGDGITEGFVGDPANATIAYSYRGTTPMTPTIVVDLLDEDGLHLAAGSKTLDVFALLPDAPLDVAPDDSAVTRGSRTAAIVVAAQPAPVLFEPPIDLVDDGIDGDDEPDFEEPQETFLVSTTVVGDTVERDSGGDPPVVGDPPLSPAAPLEPPEPPQALPPPNAAFAGQSFVDGDDSPKNIARILANARPARVEEIDVPSKGDATVRNAPSPPPEAEEASFLDAPWKRALAWFGGAATLLLGAVALALHRRRPSPPVAHSTSAKGTTP